MEHWQKLVLDPAHYNILNNLEEPKEKEELAEQTGLKEERCQKILQNLKEENLVEQKVENGVRKFHRTDLEPRIDSMKDSFRSNLIGGTKESALEGNFSEAKEYLTRELPLEGETRVKVAQIEAAEKLSKLV